MHTTPLTPGVLLRLPTAYPPDPGQLAIFQPSVQQILPFDELHSFGFTIERVRSQTKSYVSAFVAFDNRHYTAKFQQTSFGFNLKLTLISAVPATLSQPPAFDPASDARTFLGAHQLALDGLQLEPVKALPDGSKIAEFSEFAPADRIIGAHAAVTFNAQGVLIALDMQWVNTATPPLVQGISAMAALDSVAAGNGFIHTTGALPDSTAMITGTTILYVAVAGTNGVYFEPVYCFSGVTRLGATFQVYVPAIDRAYLR
jgi:hypothetical protein